MQILIYNMHVDVQKTVTAYRNKTASYEQTGQAMICNELVDATRTLR